jgi:predicted PurR-regulated permease PerM
MEHFRISEDQQLLLLLCAIYIVCILVFWPLMTVLIWAVAIAVALLPIHKRLCCRVKPSVSATFITVWALLLILLVMSLAASVLVNNEEHIGNMALSMITGLKNTGFSGYLPSFTETELLNFDETLKGMMVKAVLSLTSNIMQSLISIIIFFLSLSMLLYYGEYIWNTITCALSP